jgi:hypothetical protein
MGLWSRFLGIIFSPLDTFKNVVKAPAWLGILVVTTLIIAIFVGGFLSTEVGQEAWLEQVTESLGGGANIQQREVLKTIQPYLGFMAVGESFFMVPLISLVISGILFVIFSVILGASATFKQLFAVVVHCGVITSIQQAFIWPLNYLLETFSRPTALTALLPMLDEESFLYRFLNAIDLFFIWWIVVLSIGLGVLYQRRTKRIAVALFAVYAIIALIYAGFFGGS